ncbi:MAG: aldose epimerase family protein [Pseudomonadota bacterium]
MIDPNVMQIIELRNRNDCRATLSALGAGLRSLCVPSDDGELVDVVLGLPGEQAYTMDDKYIGVTVGRYCGRIAGGELSLPRGDVRLDRNQPPNHIHGGESGLHQRTWTVSEAALQSVEFSCTSPDRESGYPGNLDVWVRYTLRENNALQIDYRAVSDADTVINLTNHSYFNLGGHDSGDALSHHLSIRSDRIAELDGESIPTGRFLSVQDTPFDFRAPAVIEEKIGLEHPQLALAGGFDHGWLLDGGEGQLDEPVAILYSPGTGIFMRVSTDQSSVQFYSASSLPGNWAGKDGAAYGAHQGLCLETQHLPNSPNEPSFPTTMLRAGDTFLSRTVYEFGTGMPGEWATEA